MMADLPNTESALAQKFQDSYERLTEFAEHVSELHAAMPVHDEASRAAYASLSRLMAFTDQISMLLVLMREDVRVTDELTSTPVAASWTDQIDQCFLEWLRSQKSHAPQMN